MGCVRPIAVATSLCDVLGSRRFPKKLILNYLSAVARGSVA
jgi:hypothetical protein